LGGQARSQPGDFGASGVTSDTVFFPELGRKDKALIFPYPGGWKARSIEAKAFVANKGFKPSLWNLERVIRANPETVYWVEGEIDLLALVEAGIDAGQVLSVPNGATERSDPELRGYGYVEDALKAGLNRAKRFVWCGDNDAVGRTLRSDMARMLGAARFSFVDWPNDAKDANDVLRGEGRRELFEIVTQGALPCRWRGCTACMSYPNRRP
jgi:twinkle protein